MQLEHLGLIGNCQFSALVERTGSVVWCCLPRFDAEPVFSTLLDEEAGGTFHAGPAEGGVGVQRYVENTNVLETRFETETGSFRVIDFAPRFEQYSRPFRPTQLYRILEPITGTPRVRVRCEPRLGWSKRVPVGLQGSHHIRYEGFASPLRLTTDIPLSYLGGQGFTLTKRLHLVLAWGAPIEEPLPPLCDRFLNETIRYWQTWVKRCSIPPCYQQEVIRSALVLKLHCFEDTGAIVAAMTTSIPEAPQSGRTWDYRYCWLRDAFYALDAFRLLGHFEERENFTSYLLNVVGGAPNLDLAPLYRVDGGTDLTEGVLESWPGFNRDGPVRIGNAAAEHTQNDIFGEMVLALTPIFVDDRYAAERSPTTIALIERLARRAIAVVGSPDAGIWEYRSGWRTQTFSTLMCWAAADRMAKISKIVAPAAEREFRRAADTIAETIIGAAWNAELQSFVATHGGQDLDSSLLQVATLGLLPKHDERLVKTVETLQRELSQDGWMFRYRQDDGLGKPSVAFVICSFWLVQALAAIGRRDQAREVMDRLRVASSPLGLLSEDLGTGTRRMWGNFPQAYSHVGLIHAAFAASPTWSEVV